jgi:hypothetical protein
VFVNCHRPARSAINGLLIRVENHLTVSRCIGQHDGKRDTCVVDCLREWVPPFSLEVTVAEISQLLKSYNVSRVVGDLMAECGCEKFF